MRIFFLLLTTFFTYTPLIEAESLLQPLPKQDNGWTLPDSQLTSILQGAIQRKQDFFGLVTDLLLELNARKARLSISGSQLRKLDRSINFDKWNNLYTFFPVSKIDRIELGYSNNGQQKEFEVFLIAPHDGSVNLAFYHLDQYFGFSRYDVSTKTFQNAFGVSASQFFIQFPLYQMVIYEPLKISLHFNGIDKPKKYDIHPLIYR